MECSICCVNKKSEDPADKGAGSSICVYAGGIAGVCDRAEEGGVSEDGGASDLFPLALCSPLKVTERLSRFQ